jgi:hypothetical protein
MRVCIAHKEAAVTTLKDINDNSEYDLCGECLKTIIPLLNGEKDLPKKLRKVNV